MNLRWIESPTSSLPPAANRWSWLLVIGMIPFVAGCPTEVPYVEPVDSPAAEEQVPDEDVAEPIDTDEPPAIEDRYGEAPTVPEGLPWETGKQDSEASAEADRLFGGASESVAVVETVEPAAAEDEEDTGGFGDFLGEAYGLNKEDEPEVVAANEDTTESLPLAKADPPAVEDRPFDPSEFFAGSNEPAEEPVAEALPPPAKEPTTTAPADSDVLAELWGDEPVPADLTQSAAPHKYVSPEPQPEPQPKPQVIAKSDPKDQEVEAPQAELTEDEIRSPAEDFFAFDETPPADEPEERDDWVKPVEAPPTLDDEPPPAPRVASIEPRTQRLPRSTPMASSAIKPLPAVPVLPYNTRHLSWLLGGKLGLAELADLDGATPSEIAGWTDEVDRLARELQIPDPGSKTTESDPAKRVSQMMAAAARAGDALAIEHGVDHAALLEISLKTNALLVVASDHPELAAPVAAAIRSAAERAVLPRFLWEETVQTLEREPTPEQTLATVTRLHERVESFLR